MASRTLRWDEALGEEVGGPVAGGRDVNLGATGQEVVDHISKNEHHGVSSPPGSSAHDLATSRVQRWDLDRPHEQSGGRCCVTSKVRPWVSLRLLLCVHLLATNRPPCCEEAQQSRGEKKAPGQWLGTPGHVSKARGRGGVPLPGPRHVEHSDPGPTPSHEK